MNSVLLLGRPNSGKSLLFNRLTGLTQKVANFPGVTVELKYSTKKNTLWIDFPGIYSLNALSTDEKVSIDKLREEISKRKSLPTVLVCLLDATRLEQSLSLGMEFQKLAKDENIPLIFALNMMDEILSKKGQINISVLEQKLGSPIIGISAKTKYGIENLENKIHEVLKNSSQFIPNGQHLSEGVYVNSNVKSLSKSLSQEYGADIPFFIEKQNKIDQWALSSVIGSIIFLSLMFLLFQSIFTWSAPLMDGVQWAIDSLAVLTIGQLPSGILHDFLKDALFGGIGSFLVFVPQIFVLTFLIGILEDSGYLARAVIICHRPLSFLGLSGKSFIPLLSAHACAIPAIFAARTIESPKKRFLTNLIIPLMSCSARLPVYSLLITAFIPAHKYLGGLVNLQGVAFFSLYLLGIVMGLIISSIAFRLSKKEKLKSPLILELPPYRLPHWGPLFMRSWQSAKQFILKAGHIIFLVSVVVWGLGYFPNFGENLETSYLGQLGHFITPIISPLGLEWKFGVAILSSFLAREVFVGTLGTLFGMAGDENVVGLAANVQQAGVTLASGISLLVFYVLSLQCVSTLAVLKKEMGDWKTPAFIFLGYTLLAYLAALMTYKVVLLF